MSGTFEYHQQRRIDLTASCRDADAIPKVPRAGEITEHEGVRAQVMHNGVLVEAGGYYGDWMIETIRRLRGHHEPQEEACFHTVVERLRSDCPAPVMVELGAFWSYYSLWLQHVIPAAELVLVEPDPAHLACGRRNVALNGARARFVHAAVGLPDGARAEIACESDGVTRELPLVSLTGLAERADLARVDVLLCDVQGAELAALEGARALVAQGRLRFVVLSTHHHSISADPMTHQRCRQTLLEWGAHLIAEHSVPESFSGDGLVVASFDERDRDLELPLSYARSRDSLFGELEPDLAAAHSERDRLAALLSRSARDE